jgi:Leucine-rich repeat (LRR) protein
MSACHPYNLTPVKSGSTGTDACSAEVSRNCSLLVNAPPAVAHAPAKSEKPPARPSGRHDGLTHGVAPPEANVRRSRTPRGLTRRTTAADAGVGRTAELYQSPLPAVITTSRAAPNASGSDSAANTKRLSTTTVAARPPTSPLEKKRSKGRLPTSPSNVAAASAGPRPTRSRSSGPNISAVRPRTSLGSHLSDVARSSDLYTPTLSSVAAISTPVKNHAAGTADFRGGAAVAPRPIVPSSSPAVPTERGAPRESTGAVRVLATPKASQQNVDDIAQLTPIGAVASRTATVRAALPVDAHDTAKTPRGSWGGAPTSLQLDYERANSEGASQGRLSGATFSYNNVEKSPNATATAAGIAAGKPVLQNRPDVASLHPPRRSIASPKEVRRRAASAGPTSRTAVVPALSLTKIHQAFRRGSSPILISRGPHHGVLPDAVAGSDEVVAAASGVEVRVHDDSLAVSAPSLPNVNESATTVDNDFLSHAFLALDEVRAMDSDPSSISAGAGGPHAANGTTSNRSWLQRGTSTPRAYSPHTAESSSFTASPVNRVLRGKRELSASTTPRLSVSTPRFTVATNTNSLPYTARVSREGTPVTGSLSPPAPVNSSDPTVPAAAAAEKYPAAALSDNDHHGTTPRQGSPTPPRSQARVTTVQETDMQRDSQDYVAAVAEQVSRHYYVILTALDIGRGAALQAEPPVALCLRSMVIDLNTVASLLSYDSRNGIQDLLFDDCAFPRMDLAWMSRLHHLTALRFKGPLMTTAMVNRLLSYTPTVQTLTLIQTSRITSLASIATPESRVHTLQLIQTDFTSAAYENIVNSPVLRRVMLLQVQLRTNIFDLLNTNHLYELHLVGCPDIYYEGLPEAEWVSSCSPRLEALTLAAKIQKEEEKEKQKKPRAVRGGRGRGRGSSVGRTRKERPHQQQQQQQHPPPPAFPLRVLVIADCPGLQLSKVPFADFRELQEVSVMYQRGVRAADLAGVLEQGKLVTLRLQEVFVDDGFVQQLCKCRSLRELNLSFCRGMRGMEAVWPALVESLRVLNVSYSDIDDAGLAGLGECRLLNNLYARGCARLRSFDPFRRLSDSVGVIDVTDCSGLENDAFSEPFDCTGVHRLVLTGCSKVRTITGIRSLRMLEELSLANTSVDDMSFAALALDTDSVVLQTLTKLDLSGCRYLGELADFSGTSTTALRNLSSLNLSHSSISNKGIEHIARAVQSSSSGGCLSELDVSGCTGVSQLGPLGAVKTLRVLNASFSAVDDDGLSAFVKTSVDTFNRELRVLNLSGCTCVTKVGCLGQLSRLVVLNLAGTTVDGPASFADLANCTGLQELDLSECTHLASVTELVPRLTKLHTLNLSLTGIGDDSVAALGVALKDLETLQLSGCPRVTSVAALESLPLLQRLNISATRVTDVAPLARCPQLWDLSVCSCAALTSLQPLAHAHTLQRLDASNTPVTSASFEVEWECAALEELDVHECRQLQGVKLGVLRKLTSLRRVNAESSGFDDSAVAALAECENLCEVQLSNCPITSLSLLGVVPTLQSIVAHNIGVNDEGIAGLEVSESLSTLDLTSCGDLRDVSVLRTMRNLTVLTLRGSGVTDVSFAGTSGDATSWERSGIRELNVSACAGIRKPAGLSTLPGLEELRAAGSGLTDAGLRMIAQCPALRRLYVSDCEQLTDLSPLALLDGLTHLDASNTHITTLARPVTAEKNDDVEEKANGDESPLAPAAVESLTGWVEASRLRNVALRYCPDLGDISALRHLAALYSVDLTGSGITSASFEQSWAACESLEEVTLTECTALQHVKGLWHAPHLMQLRLDRTAVDSLGGAESCASLEVLEVSECKRLKSIAEVRALPRLQQLQCRGSDITDDSFAEPWTAANLLDVTFAGCLQLRDIGALSHLPQLRSANFADTYITDGAVLQLSAAPMLEDLDLRGCSRLAHLGSLSRMPRIRALYLSRTCIGNFTFTSLSRCKKLEVLEMESCPYVTNVFVVFEFGQLRFLKFPPLSRMVGSVLHTCHHLEYLSLHGCPSSFEIESLSILPRLRVLDFRESAIKKSVLAALNDCAALEEVDVSYCADLTSLEAMGRLPRLRCFWAAGLPVTDEVCVKLTEYPLLEKIVLAECRMLRDVSALQRLPQLHHLDISESGACEASFIGIRHMRALEELSVHGCMSIRSCRLLTEAADREEPTAGAGFPTAACPSSPLPYAATVMCLPRLRLVDLSNTGITAASSTADIAALRRQCPLLTKIYLSGSRASSSVPSHAANIWRKLAGG